MEESLVAQLLADAALAALVARRIKWLARPQASALPAVVLQVVSGPRGYTFAGPDGLTGYLVQIDCWAGTYPAAKGVARAAIAALGALSAPFQAAFVEGERDSFEAGPAATDFFRTSLDVRVWHQEP